MLGRGVDFQKTGSRWSWQRIAFRRRRLLQLLGVLVAVLVVVACASLLLQLHWHHRRFLLRLSSPVSPLQADHPLNLSEHAEGRGHAQAGKTGTMRGLVHPSPAAAANASIRKSQRFFQAATAAAAQGGVVLQWGDATIRMLRGAGVGEVFFLFYEPRGAPVSRTSKSDELPGGTVSEQQADPLEVFKQLAQEDRGEQQHHQLPFVAVPRHEMHRLSFFLPEYAERVLPLAMVVRLNSGWTKFQAPAMAPYSLTGMRAFLSSYRQGSIAPLLRTEPLPILSGEEQVVTPTVASNFASVILEQTAYDSLVLLYANWCGHCRRFQKSMEKLAERFSGISSIAFFKLDVSRNDVPVPGLRVERVPHVVFFVRDPERWDDAISSSSTGATEVPQIAASAASTAESGDPASASWHVGNGERRKSVFTFSHAEPDILTYGEAFLLQHAACKSIDLQMKTDCNKAEGKDAEDL